jgi:predicted flap endonuclease-1-like 5' DNA nuclease
MANIKMLEGVGEVYAEKLSAAGVSTTDDLLEKGASAKGRAEIAAKSGVTETLILKWVNHCDLYRLDGAGEEYIDLLEASGVDTVPELAQRNADNLYQKLVETNEAKKLTRKLPSQDQVAKWVAQAKTLPRVVNY